ncbi:hypothetical protein F4859DRAFT_460170 [Xylaria cf. heliscus]|nr:hypothetical protein F4859DRAFT_460170 [Xylaria cf. heliscus]
MHWTWAITSVRCLTALPFGHVHRASATGSHPAPGIYALIRLLVMLLASYNKPHLCFPIRLCDWCMLVLISSSTRFSSCPECCGNHSAIQGPVCV